MTNVPVHRGTGYARVLSEQPIDVTLPKHCSTLSLTRWGVLPEFVNLPSENRRHLSLVEQRVMQRALRRSIKVLHKATRRP